VLGGIAVGIITAAFGVLAVPGWVESAQDASTMNDLANVRIAQAATVSDTGKYASSLSALRDASGVRLSGSGLDTVAVDTRGDGWCATALSDSGSVYAVSNRVSAAQKGTTRLTAEAAASCAPVQCPTTSWDATYYDGISWAGAPILRGCLPELNWSWSVPSTKTNPVVGLPMSNYSAVYKRTINAGAGTYTFTLRRDDIAFVYIDGVNVPYEPVNHTVDVTLTVPLSAGPHDIEVRYAQGGGGARLNLSWTIAP